MAAAKLFHSISIESSRWAVAFHARIIDFSILPWNFVDFFDFLHCPNPLFRPHRRFRSISGRCDGDDDGGDDVEPAIPYHFQQLIAHQIRLRLVRYVTNYYIAYENSILNLVIRCVSSRWLTMLNAMLVGSCYDVLVIQPWKMQLKLVNHIKNGSSTCFISNRNNNKERGPNLIFSLNFRSVNLMEGFHGTLPTNAGFTSFVTRYINEIKLKSFHSLSHFNLVI